MYRFSRVPYFTLLVRLANLRKRLQHMTVLPERKEKTTYRTEPPNLLEIL